MQSLSRSLDHITGKTPFFIGADRHEGTTLFASKLKACSPSNWPVTVLDKIQEAHMMADAN